MHGGGDPDGDVVLSAGNLHDPAGFGLTHVHVAHVLHGPQQVALCQGSTVFAPVVEDGNRGVACGFHLFQCLPDGIIIVQICTHRLWCQKKLNIIHGVLLFGAADWEDALLPPYTL